MISPASLGCIPYNCPSKIMPVLCGSRRPTGSAPSFVMPASVMDEVGEKMLGAWISHKSSAWIGRKWVLDVFGTS